MQTQSITVTIPEFNLSPQVISAVIITVAVMLVVMGLASLIRRMRQPKAAVHKPPQPAVVSNARQVQQPIFSAAIGPQISAPHSLTKRSLDELLVIEESLLAMRELYQRKLIPADVYVSESLKYSV
jgi:hypothetical protein